MNELDLDKIANEIMLKNNVSQETLLPVENKTDNDSSKQNFTEKVENAISNQVDRRLSELNKDKTFQTLSNKVTDKETEVQLKEKMLDSLSKEQENELKEYLIQCEKDKLKFRKKKEKELIKEEVKAEVQKRKIDALWERYGYLYNGDKTKFVPNKINNTLKEIANFYENSSLTFKKIVRTSMRLLLFIGVGYLIFTFGKDAFIWVLKNININNIGV